jgi:hypothetical protein
MWSSETWPFYRASVRHQIDVMVAFLLRGIDPSERFFFYDDPEEMVSLAREIAAGG